MQTHLEIDGGRKIDWGKTSEDYAQYRPSPPRSLYSRLQALEIGLPGQRILDLATGTGVVARQLAKQGCAVSGIDIAEGQIRMARQLAEAEGLKVDFRVGAAENLPFENNQFDVVIASQCWWYFDLDRLLPEIRRVLRRPEYLVVTHFNYLSIPGSIVEKTENLVLQFSPNWTGAHWAGRVDPMPIWADGKFNLRGMFYYDADIEFSRASWMGRVRACRGVAAALSESEVESFDVEHEKLLSKIAPETFSIKHRIDAHIFEFKT